MAPAASYDFHVDEQAAIAAKRAFSPSLLSLSYRDGERRVYSSKRDYPSFAGQRIFPPRDSSSPSHAKSTFARDGKEERTRVFVHVAHV